MKEVKYHIVASATFEKKYKKLLSRNLDIREYFAVALSQLERDPTQGHLIKKLVGIAGGDGVWRVRMGVYRMRYDIDGHTVTLHTIGLRRDIYRRK